MDYGMCCYAYCCVVSDFELDMLFCRKYVVQKSNFCVLGCFVNKQRKIACHEISFVTDMKTVLVAWMK